jgi:hypothetical protein
MAHVDHRPAVGAVGETEARIRTQAKRVGAELL